MFLCIFFFLSLHVGRARRVLRSIAELPPVAAAAALPRRRPLFSAQCSLFVVFLSRRPPPPALLLLLLRPRSVRRLTRARARCVRYAFSASPGADRGARINALRCDADSAARQSKESEKGGRGAAKNPAGVSPCPSETPRAERKGSSRQRRNAARRCPISAKDKAFQTERPRQRKRSGKRTRDEGTPNNRGEKKRFVRGAEGMSSLTSSGAQRAGSLR